MLLQLQGAAEAAGVYADKKVKCNERKVLDDHLAACLAGSEARTSACL
jgi:hypothetical protein